MPLLASKRAALLLGEGEAEVGAGSNRGGVCGYLCVEEGGGVLIFPLSPPSLLISLEKAFSPPRAGIQGWTGRIALHAPCLGSEGKRARREGKGRVGSFATSQRAPMQPLSWEERRAILVGNRGWWVFFLVFFCC